MARLLCLLSLLTQCAIASYVYVGTGTCDGNDHGCRDDKDAEKVVHRLRRHQDGALEPAGTTQTPGMPVWLAHRAAEGSKKSCVFATLADLNSIFSLTTKTSFKTGGEAPVYADVALGGRVLLVADYHGPDDTNSSVGAGASAFTIADDCGLKLTDFVPHSGHSVNPQRQGGAHVHSFVPLSAISEIAFACDLGQDLIFTYLVGRDGKLKEAHRTKTAPGSGPRHIAVHPSLKHIYVVSEMGMTVTTYEVGTMGELDLKQTLSLVAEGASGEGSKAAEIAILPSGQAVYATNRGNLNTVTAFAVGADGLLKQIQQIETLKYPRGMVMSKSGDQLFVLQQSGPAALEIYDVQADGRLAPGRPGAMSEALPPHPATLVEVDEDLAAADAGVTV